MIGKKIDDDKLRKLWATTMPTVEISDAMEHSPGAVRNKARRLGLPSRGLRGRNGNATPPKTDVAKHEPKPLLSTITDLAEAIREYGDTYRGRAAIAAQFGTAETRVTLAYHAMRENDQSQHPAADLPGQRVPARTANNGARGLSFRRGPPR